MNNNNQKKIKPKSEKIKKKFIALCIGKTIAIINDIPDNPGFFVIFLIGIFGLFESNSEGLQAIMAGIGFWGMMSSVMMEEADVDNDPDNDYWINFWLICHVIKFIIFLFLSWKLLFIQGITRTSIYMGLIIIDLIIINKAIYHNNKHSKSLKNKKKILSKIK